MNEDLSMDITQPNLNTFFHQTNYLLSELIDSYRSVIGQYRFEKRLYFEGLEENPDYAEVFETLKADLQTLLRFQDNLIHSRKHQIGV